MSAVDNIRKSKYTWHARWLLGIVTNSTNLRMKVVYVIMKGMEGYQAA